VRVDETGQDGLAAEVYLLLIPSSQRQDFFILADRKKTAVENGDRVRPGLAGVHCPEIAVVEDKLGLRALHGK